jgi:hypothetical protein
MSSKAFDAVSKAALHVMLPKSAKECPLCKPTKTAKASVANPPNQRHYTCLDQKNDNRFKHNQINKQTTEAVAGLESTP